MPLWINLLYAVLALAASETRGEELFLRRCSGCHALDLNKEGPLLRGVVGRKAGAVPGFGYSDALRNSGLVWDNYTLDRWLTDPDTLVPGTDMEFRLADSEERTAVIAYLRSLPSR